MARTLSLTELYTARYQFMQSIAWELWADSQAMDREPYPPGVQPSADLADALEEMEETWHAEMP